MILISVKSEVVDDKRQFKSDASALKFLKRINNLHLSHRLRAVGEKPKKMRGKGMYHINKTRFENYYAELSSAIPLRIEIINTKHNQLNLPL